MSRVSDKFWSNISPGLRQAARDGIISSDIIEKNKPTHVLDIYKARRSRYNQIRIWIKLHLGTGEREDLFITNRYNQPIRDITFDIITSSVAIPLNDWKGELNA